MQMSRARIPRRDPSPRLQSGATCRTFIRRMLDLLKGVRHHPLRPCPIRLNSSDLTWWRLFSAEWNEVLFLSLLPHLPKLHMASDASGSWGCGAWHGREWFQLRWDARSAPLSIMLKELFPIVLAWGPAWGSHSVVVHCDNQAVLACLHSHDKHIMHMLRTLAFVEAIQLLPEYINTRDNHLADDLSRDKLLLSLQGPPRGSQGLPPLFYKHSAHTSTSTTMITQQFGQASW